MGSTKPDFSYALQQLPQPVGEGAGERLFFYAHVQRRNCKAAVKAQCSDDTADLYRPAMGLLAKRMSTRRALLDAVAATPRVPSVQRDEPAAIQSSTSALPRCWQKFLSRTAERERQRLARLRNLKLQVVESAVEECTFRPRLSPQTSRCPARDCDSSGAAPHATSSTTVINGEERSSHARTEEWAATLAMFEVEMQALQNTLVRFRPT
ncbi:hypothetical protein LMJF_16_0130 [Leishmania major strain Friedlin]|uniref:Uncharacterized protein n=1 Tax=Leishmania major TaxID=5664 RepID=Q4QF07_LEIMA|nr:hypothetical protein LMJF_16_0130 [Leishmania major strain Friedlin]CAG9572047.1 hypothetical_protein_-_conserved [Leishmania major strain Friedlin]CAJ03428.1 hypothetical protein LMJF_16_0130 [Leishmania major strain Friedlin]|eukprot:XP_001682091.1 hypothetical protein LMJF_16_0130 [Leishmania major strain Friedlin]